MTPCSRSARIAAVLGSVLAALPACDAADGPMSPVAPAATAGGAAESHLMLEGIELRPGASADIHVRMYRNAMQPCADPERTALLVHGVNATAASWESFAEAFLEGEAGRRMCTIAALDQAGHGNSGLPVGMPFGELLIEDYARTLIGVLDRLHDLDIRPSILVAHSQGTSTVQTAQQMLRDGGSSLRTRFGVRDVVMLGVQGPREVRVGFLLPPETVAGIIAAYITTTPERGTYIQGPADLFQQLWFINTQLAFSTKTPAVETIATRGWNADAPLFAVLQAAGLSGFDTPSVDPGVFGPASGSTLRVIDFADDPWSLTPRAAEIYQYLSGDASLAGFTSLVDPLGDAVHDYMITHPGVVRSAIPLPRTRARRSARR